MDDITALPADYTVTFVEFSVPPGLGLGLWAVVVTILTELYGKGAVNAIRFARGKWKREGPFTSTLLQEVPK